MSDASDTFIITIQGLGEYVGMVASEAAVTSFMGCFSFIYGLLVPITAARIVWQNPRGPNVVPEPLRLAV